MSYVDRVKMLAPAARAALAERLARRGLALHGSTDVRLVAYVVPEADAVLSPEDLRESAAATLPEYMVPSAFIQLDALPRTPNGKLDNARLPAPEAAVEDRRGADGEPEYDDEVMERLAAVWRRLLDTTPAPDDNFFELGGHSLMGVSLMLEVEREFGVEVPLAALFEAPTLRGLARRIHRFSEGEELRFAIPIQSSGSLPPLFCVHGGARLLARHLGKDQPVYLLFHDAGDMDAEDDSVERVAAVYLEEMRRIQPTGPYYLCGFSYGGMLTFEIASQLARAGEQVAFLALLEPAPLEGAVLKLGLQRKLEGMRAAGGSADKAVFVLREALAIPLRRVRNVWNDIQLAYYKAVARTRLVYSAAAAVAFVGLSLIVAAGAKINAPQWFAVDEPITLEAGESVSVDFIAQQSRRHEIELEFERALPREVLATTALAIKQPSELDVEWSVWRGAEMIANGDAAEHYYLDLAPRTTAGKVGYILFRIPTNRSHSHRDSFGLAGRFTWARGIGAVRLVEGESYTLRAEVGRSFPELAATAPRLTVRLSRRFFNDQLEEMLALGYLGIAVAAFAPLIAGIGFLRRRQAVPARLLRHRNLRHNKRVGRRYAYGRHDGDVVIFLAERSDEIRQDTIASWRPMIGGELEMEIIDGARRHLDLIDSDQGAALAERFRQRLAVAREQK